MLENVLESLKYFPELNVTLGMGVLIFARFFGFVLIAPIFSRKDIPFLIKTCLVLLLTVAFIGILPHKAPPVNSSLFVSIVLNFIFGSLIGFIANCIFSTITAAGDMISMQMGLSAAAMFDANTKSQSSPVGRFFTLLSTVIFINIGGLFWLFNAFQRGFEIFPLYNTGFVVEEILSLDYLTSLTGNVLFMGFQIASPVIIMTLCMDLILGIISKTAPQINVFQLSFLFKPIVGSAVLLITIPIMINIITDYFMFYSRIIN